MEHLGNQYLGTIIVFLTVCRASCNDLEMFLSAILKANPLRAAYDEAISGNREHKWQGDLATNSNIAWRPQTIDVLWWTDVWA